uniref:Tyrosinase copper-binding domain-containing protein n=1 Tax=Compsopogon caeruleus TaxID=31354 RepID=A0A7S1XGZ2_9RHOD|mmetsp:Transcript_7232/g.14868  ORF Transcript_7232/g.14868 Transcript_7232/m.14868 type:complete len:153 (+) Transcript_7232:185-643(+)
MLRWFIFYFESALRAFDPSVTLPYWDAAFDASNPTNSIIFTSSRTGQATGGSSIRNSKFRNWWSDVPVSHYITRWLDSSVALENTQSVYNQMQNSDPCSFMTAFQTTHGYVHLFVGGSSGPEAAGRPYGDMTLLSQSPNDPIFFIFQYVFRH